MAPDHDTIRALASAHERGTLIFPLPQSIYNLRGFIAGNKARLGTQPELQELVDRQEAHLFECEQALSLVLSRLQGERGFARCPTCHRQQTTRGGVFERHNGGTFLQAEGLVESPMCSGSGRRV